MSEAAANIEYTTSYPSCTWWTDSSSGFDIVEVVVTSLFVFSKRRRAKHNPNVAVSNLEARI